MVPAGGSYVNSPATPVVAFNCAAPSGVPYAIAAGAAQLSTGTALLTTSDTVAGVTTLNLNGQVWSDFVFTTNAGFGLGTYVLIAATNMTGAFGATVSGSVGGYTGRLSVNGSNDLVLTVSSSGSTPGPLTSVVAAGGNVSFTASGSGLLIVQVSTNLVDWVSLLTNTAPFSFTDTNAVNTYPRRFYRTKTP